MKIPIRLIVMIAMLLLPVFISPCAKAAPQLMLGENIEITNSPFIGAENSPITIIAFIDYQCPYCKQYELVIQQVVDKYANKIKLIFKHFPLPFHEFAKNAALASLAANDQGKFWEFHVKLFENSPNLCNEVIQKIAKELRLDIDRFNNKMKSPEFKLLVKNDSLEGMRVGIIGTPTVYVNKKLLLDHSFIGLQKMIESELKK